MVNQSKMTRNAGVESPYPRPWIHQTHPHDTPHFRSTLSERKLRRFNTLIFIFRLAAFCFALSAAVFMLATKSDSPRWYDFGAFRKVDQDRWDFSNEGFLGGQRHLLKTIRRRRNIAKYEQYGMAEELEALKRDRSLLMAEIVRLRQLQQHSKDQLIAMENRLRTIERKQHNMMGFLAKAFSNPELLQRYMDKYSQKGQDHIEIGRKSRLMMTPTPSVENLEQVAAAAGMKSIQSNVDSFLAAPTPVEDESSNNVGNRGDVSSFVEDDSSGNFWEELLNVNLPLESDPEEFLDGQNLDWDEDLQELVDQMEYLSSSNA